jgi:hypothetical protein
VVPRTSERLFFVGLAVLVLGLAAVDAGLGGAERPFLVFILVGGVLVLWFLTRQYSRVPERWRRRKPTRTDRVR